MQEMVTWPDPTGSFRDSGEGGLFAWLIVPEALSSGEAYGANVYGNNCHVDVSAYLSRPRVMLTSPNVCVSPERSKIFTPYQHRDSWFDHTRELLERLDKAGDRPLKQALYRSMGADDVSVPMLAAVFLGSTHHSLYDETAGAYFRVRFEHLTQQGKQVYEALRLVYGVDPLILTFLDT